MSDTAKKNRQARLRRHRRVRKKVKGTAERPRLAVFKSNRNITAQVIDDRAGRTLAAVSTVEASIEGAGGNVDAATRAGELLAQRATEAGITTVVFDRGGNLYHGRIAALADAARKGGLEF